MSFIKKTIFTFINISYQNNFSFLPDGCLVLKNKNKNEKVK